MRLFYSPGACSLVSHVALEESGAPFEAVAVPIAEGANYRPDYLAVNPRGLIPALQIGERVIAETIAILTWIAHAAPDSGVLPLGEPLALSRTYELLSYFATSVHAGAFRPVYQARAQGEAAVQARLAEQRPTLETCFADIEALYGDGPWLLGARFSAADTYPLTFRRWARRLGFDMRRFSAWTEHAERLVERPSVQRALAREGLAADEF
jgi:glutathione S-transferase